MSASAIRQRFGNCDATVVSKPDTEDYLASPRTVYSVPGGELCRGICLFKIRQADSPSLRPAAIRTRSVALTST